MTNCPQFCSWYLVIYSFARLQQLAIGEEARLAIYSRLVVVRAN